VTAAGSPGAGDDLASVRDELRAVARDLLRKTPPAAAADWGMFASAGWLGLEVPAFLDGADATFAEVAVIAQELGRAAAAGPYLGAIVLGVGALRELPSCAGRDELLRRAANGDALPVAVLAGGAVDGVPGAGAPGAAGPAAGGSGGRADVVPFRLERAAAGWRLHGHAAFVPDAARATRLLVLARDGADGEPVIADVDPGAAGLHVAERPVLDETRSLAVVNADGAEVAQGSVWRFARDPQAAVARLLDRAAVAVACDSLGLAEAMLDATVGYARVREQFGRPIGSFQAVKHACADMLVAVSVSRELVSAAVAALASGEPDAAVAASMAKAYACGAAVDVAGKAMQLHGGIGYTWESGIHVYLKRAALNRALFGSPAAHRQRLAARYR
jgi:alkylation response protein AidB-like acyl-CoA dehydrogenase